MRPADGSKKRSINAMRVLLPEPLGPASAVISPTFARKLTALRTGERVSYEKLTFSNANSLTGGDGITAPL